MPEATSRIIPQIRQKLFLLYGYAKDQSDTALSERLNVKKNTVSDIINGVPGKRGAGSVTRDQLTILASLLVEATNGRISLAHATALWLQPKDTFGRALAGPPSSSLLALLAANSEHFDVTMTISEPGRLGMVEDDPEIPDGTTSMSKAECVEFHLQVRKGRCLTVIYECADGWFSLVPGTRHTGQITNSLENVPSRDHSRYGFEKAGLYRFVFIETVTTEPIRAVPSGSIAKEVAPEYAEALCTVLSDRDQVPQWRWAEIFIRVERSGRRT
jgi:hypothetical protein